jgi:hypothetical protein
MSNYYLVIYHNQKGTPHLRSQHTSLRQAKGFLARNPQLKDFTVYKASRFPRLGEDLEWFLRDKGEVVQV